MKKAIYFLGLVLLTQLALSCSSPAYVQKDDSANMADYKTYMWVNTSSSENEESKRATAYADISIHNAVNEELSNWGWREVTSNPDVLLSYDVFVERNTETQRDAVYSQPFTRYYYNPYTRRWSTIYYPSQFQGYQIYETPVKEGTITITIVDAKTDKSVWQGWTTERLASSTLSDSEIKKSVRNIFKQST